MTEIYLLVGIAALVLQILIIVKFFQIASDVRAIKNAQVSNPLTPTPLDQISSNTQNEIKGQTGEISHIIKGRIIEFSDGLKGEIVRYSGYPECSVITDDGFELLYNNIEYATTALHLYLLNKTESKDGLYEKRQFKGKTTQTT